MHRLHMSGEEPQRTADSGPGGAPMAAYTPGVSTGALEGAHFSTGALEGGCGPGWEEVAGSSSLRLAANPKIPGPPMPCTGSCA